jgi:hypothetical protein
MKPEFKLAMLDAVRNHPLILRAAITASHACQGGPDRHSDLDLLLAARDVDAVREVSRWVPKDWKILICAFHLTHYCTVLLDDLEKLDLAIFSAEDPPSIWVVHDYMVVKGDEEFGAQLAEVAAACRTNKAAHQNRDVCMDNILLLLITALKRVDRGELLSAHAFLAMAADMLISFERLRQRLDADADLLDPRRRIERNHPEVARALQESWFVPPDSGNKRLGEYLRIGHRQSMPQGQRRVVDCLLKHCNSRAARSRT